MLQIENQIESEEPREQGKFIRVEQGDWNQCQATHANFQCPYRATGNRNSDGTWDGICYCPRHGGSIRTAQAKAETRMYMLSKFQARVESFADHPRLKSLRDDIAILRMTLENKFSQITDSAELEMRSASVAELVNSIAKTIQISHKIEKDSGSLLDKTQCLAWIATVVDIISTHITDPIVLRAIGTDILLSLDSVFPPSS